MSLRFNHSGDSEQNSPYELSAGQSLELNPGDSLKLDNPDDIADLVPQGRDVLVLTKDGSSYLLKNFLLADNNTIELPDGTSIAASDFVIHRDESDSSKGDTELQALKIESNEYTGSLAIQSVAILSIVSQLSQDSSAFEAYNIREDGAENPDLRSLFQNTTLSLIASSTRRTERAPSPEKGTLEHVDVDAQSTDEVESEATSNSDEEPPTRTVSIDVTELVDLNTFDDLDSVRITTNTLNSDDEKIPTETVVDPASQTITAIVEIERDDAGQQVDIEVIVIDPDDDRVIDRSDLAVVLPDPFNDQNLTLSLSGTEVLENESGYTIGKLSAIGSADGIQGSISYSIVNDSNSLFEIEGSTLKLKDGFSIDFETAPDSYTLTIGIRNADGVQIDRIITLNPADANDAPELSLNGIEGGEDSPIFLERETFEHSFSDVDADDSLFSIRFDSLPGNGTLILGSEPIQIGQTIFIEEVSEVVFNPEENWNGQTGFLWSGYDGTAWSTQSTTLSIDIESVNDTPIATFSIGPQTTNEDAAFLFQVPSELFADADSGDTLTLSANLPSWLTFDATSGIISGIPSYQNVGGHLIEITATDTSGKSVTTRFDLQVDNINDLPTFTQIRDVFISETDLIEIDAGSNFSDEDSTFGDSLNFSASLADGSELPDWLTIDETTGRITGNPPQGQDTDLQIRVTATDQSFESASSTFAFHISNLNDAPEILASIEDQSSEEDAPFSFDISRNFYDSDLANTLTYQATLPDGTTLPEWLAFDSSTGTFSGTPGNEDVGMHAVTVIATDGEKSISDTFAIMVQNTNDGPVATGIANQTTSEDQTFTLDVSDHFTDIDTGDTLSFSATLTNGSELPDWLTFDEKTGIFSGVPENEDVGELSILVVASDGQENANAIFSIEVENTNNGPVATFIPEQSASEDSLFLFDASTAFSDIDGDDLTFSATLENGEPLPSWITINRYTGEISGTPENSNVGTTSLTVSASDGTTSVASTFSIEVENTNNGPVVSTSITNKTLLEDTSFNLNISDNFSDADLGDILTFTATLENGDPLPSWLAFDSESGEFSGTPSNDDIGSFSLKVLATDGEASAESTFQIEVENQNDSPVVWTSIDDQNTNEDAAFILDVSSNFGDVDAGDTLTYNATLSNGDPLPAWLQIDSNSGVLSGTPENSDVGSINITVTATDSSDSKTSDTFSIQVENTNDGPIATADSENATEDGTSITGNLLENDYDPDANDSLSISSVGEASYGTLTVNADGAYTYAIDNSNPTVQALGSGETLQDTVYYRVTDQSGAQSTATLTITISGTNDGITTVADIDSTSNSLDEDATEGTTVGIAAAAIDADLTDTVSYSVGDARFTVDADGTVKVAEGATFDAETEANVDIVVTATSTDGSTSSETFAIAINDIDEADVSTISDADSENNAIDENASEGTRVGVTAFATDDDITDTVTYSVDDARFTVDADGTVKVAEGATFDAETEGSIDVVVTATSTDGSTSHETFSIAVNDVDEVDISAVTDTDNTADAISESASNGDHVGLTAFAYDADASDNPVTYSLSDNSNGAFAIDASTGEVTVADATMLDYESDTSQTIEVTATSADGSTSTRIYTIAINDSDEFDISAISDTDAAANTLAENAIEGTNVGVSANATDADGSNNTVTYSVDDARFTVEANGTIRVAAGAEFDAETEESIDLLITATSSDGSTSQESFTIAVSDINEAGVSMVVDTNTTTNEITEFAHNGDAVGITAEAEDADLTNSDVSYSITNDPSGAFGIDSSSGVVVVLDASKLNYEDASSHTIEITATSTDGSTSAKSFIVNVNDENEAPTVIPISDQTTNEDAAFSIDASTAFADVDAGDILTFTATLEGGAALPSWLSIDPATGKLSGTPENGDVGSISVTVTATDTSGSTASDTFGIQIDNTNDGPTASTISEQTTDEDAAFSLDVSGNFADVDAGDTLTYSATLQNGSPLPSWLSIDPATGELSGTPENGDVGSISVTVTATDSAGATASDTFGIQVDNTNDGPTASAIDDQTTDEDAAFSLDVSGNFADVDEGDTLTFSATVADGSALPSWLSIDSVTGELSGTPENGDVGSISVTVTATDSEGATASDTFGIQVDNTNDGPTASAIADQITDEDAAFSLTVSGNFADVDEGDSLSYAATLQNGDPLPSWLSIDPETGELSGTPKNGDVGSISVTVTATDESGAIASDTFGIQVDNTSDGPTASAIDEQTTDEDAAFSLDVSENFADTDVRDSLSYTATLEGGSALPSWLSIDPATGELSGTPENGDVGSISVTVTATDSAGATASDTFGIQVDNTNDGPTASAIDDQTTDEDAAFSLDTSANFADADAGDTLTFTATLENGSALPSWLSIDPATGELSGTPENGDVGSLSVTVTATDSAGATASDTFGIQVDNTNDGPTASAIDDQTTDEDAAFSLDVSGNFAEVDAGDTLTFSATLEDGSALPSWLSIDPATGELSGIPENSDVGSISVTVTATDSAGATASDTFGIQVDNTNDGPTATAISNQTTDEDAAFSLDVSGNFSDVDAGDSLSYTATLEDGSALPSWLSIDPATGELSGTPENGDVGSISVTVSATDSAGAIASDTFGIQVDNTNDGPTASAIAEQTTDEDATFSLDVSGNFADVDEGDTLTFSATLADGSALPSWLSIDSVKGELSGTPENGDVGSISVTVTATDTAGSTASDTFGIQVENTNDRPTASAIADQTTDEDAAFSLDVSGNFADVDVGDTLTYSATLQNGDPLPGWLSINATTGELSGTPENGDVGIISVKVIASDGEASESDIFNITVENTNDGPTASHAYESLGLRAEYFDVGSGVTQLSNINFENAPDFTEIVSEVNFNAGHGAVYSGGASDHFGIRYTGSINVTESGTWDFKVTGDDGYRLFIDGEVVVNLDYQHPSTATTGSVELTEGNHSIELIYFEGQGTSNLSLEWQGPSDSEFSLVSGNSLSHYEVVTAVEDASFSLDISSDFSDVDVGDTLTFTVTLEDGSPVPSWLTVNASTGVLSGTPENGDVGTLTVKVTATDAAGSAVSSNYDLQVENTNDGPTVTTTINDQNLVRGDVFSLDVSGNFEDTDIGDKLTYSATLENGDPLPSWLSLNSSTGKFSGTPGQADSGVISLKVIASDGSANAEEIFTIDVEAIVTQNGNEGANTIDGDAYNDVISGGKGADTIDAGSGDDTIYGDDSPDNTTSSIDNYLMNGSFEDVSDGESINWGIIKSNVSGWTDANGNRFEMHTGNWEGMETATDGSYFLDMGESPGQMDISQTVSGLLEGSSYTLTFDAGDRKSDLSNSMEVYFGGQLIATIDPGQEDIFESYSFEVTGGMGDGSNTLRFLETGTIDNRGISLDNVKLVETNASNDDTIDGGDGTDTLVLTGTQSEYEIVRNSDDTYTVTDLVDEREGTDTISNIEYIQFSDTTLSVDDATSTDPNQTYIGNDTNETIVTGSGHDYIETGYGTDSVDSGAGDDTIIGSSNNETIHSGSGNDSIHALGGSDTIDAGSGDDEIFIGINQSLYGSSIDGGEGDDTVHLELNGYTLDFTTIDNSHVKNIERLDIEGNTNDTLRLSVEDVLDMTDGENRLFIDGNSGDTVEIASSYASQGTENIEGTDYTHYYDSTSDTHLYINNDITDTPTF